MLRGTAAVAAGGKQQHVFTRPLFGACTLRTVWRALFLSLSLSLCEHGYTMTVLVERCQSAWGRRARWGSCYGLTRHERTRARACVRCEYSLRVQSSYVFRRSSTIYVRLCTRGVLRARACALHGLCTLGVVPCSCWRGVVESLPLVLERLEGPAARLGDTCPPSSPPRSPLGPPPPLSSP